MLVGVQLSVNGIVSPAGVQQSCRPDDHFAAGPHCRVSIPAALGALMVLVAVQLSCWGCTSAGV